jgi:hypothetical protein
LKNNTVSKKGKSTGPKTAAGKARSSQNAITHGFFSRELARTEEEKAELAALREGVRNDLQPQGMLLEMAFDQVVVCVWKLKRAMKLDEQCMAELVHSTAPPEEAQESELLLRGLYADSAANLRRQIELLDQAVEEIKGGHAVVHPDTLYRVQLTFGSAMAELMSDWRGTSLEDICVQEMVEKRRLYNLDPPKRRQEPPMDATPEEAAAWRQRAEAAAAAEAAQAAKDAIVPDKPEVQMLINSVRQKAQDTQIIWLREQLLSALEQVQRSAVAVHAGPPRLDLALRYVTKAQRDLEQAQLHYFRLRRKLRRRPA